MATLSRLVVNLETNTANFDRGMQNATRTVGTFGRAVEVNGRGVTMLTRGLETLTLRAAGLPGPIGLITRGLGEMVGFTGPLGLLVGAIGALAVAYKAVADNAARASKEHMDFMRSLNPQGFTAPGTTVAGNLQAQLARLGNLGPFVPTLPGDFQQMLENQFFEAAQDALQSFASSRRFRLPSSLFDLARATSPSLTGGLADTAGLMNINRLPRPGGPLTGLDLSGNATFLRTQHLNSLAIMEAQDKAAAKAAGAANALNGLAGGIALLGAVSGRTGNVMGQLAVGVGGILGGIKGVNPLIGAGIGIFGEIVNLFGGGKKALPVEVKNFDELKKDTRPIIISNNFVGGTPDQVRDVQLAIGRAIRLGSIPRTSTRAA